MNNQQKCIDEVMYRVIPTMRAEFRRFVMNGGEASQEFLDYLDRDVKCQVAVDIVLDDRAASLRELMKAFDEVKAADG
ncbi:MAG: hypothetical protein ACRC1K_03905, partial [Planctomycetia bacterium]